MTVEESALGLHFLRAFSVPKWADQANEDRWCVSEDGTVCAVSDGASVSYDPGPWAEIITHRFVEHQNVDAEWIDSAAAACRSAYDRDAMEWMQQAAFDRGSFASLLGVVVDKDEFHACVFGDSLLAWLDDGQTLRSIPYSRADEFDSSPMLLSTNPRENVAIKETELPNAWHNLPASGVQALLVMTDALGRWLLESPDMSRFGQLAAILDANVFAEFVETERAATRMRRDDTTLVVMSV